MRKTMEIVMNDQELLEICKTRLDYNSDTGIFIWKISNGYRAIAGEIAGTKVVNSYRQISINNKKFYSHRIAFLMTYGYQPKYVDHINGDKADNRIVNLRECTNTQNLSNRGPQSNNTSGYKGVTWVPSRKKWLAQLRVDGKNTNHGRFNCKHEAARVYNTAARMYHGEFAYTNEVPIV